MSNRRRAVGAELVAGGVHFRLWAPARQSVAVVIEGGPEIALEREDGGHFSAFVKGIAAGARYRFRLDDERETFPDPASRFQPEGPHGPSAVVDPHTYRWNDSEWRGVNKTVLYEMHVGT